MPLSPCCFTGFQWDGTPAGREDKLAGINCYVAGDDPSAAILIVHDLFGWTFPNARLLADHYAREVGATVYLPDFLGGEEMPTEMMLQERWKEIDIFGIIARHPAELREPEIVSCAKALRDKYARVGSIGFCWGAAYAFRLGGKQHQPPLVDCVSMGHPTLLVKEDIDNAGAVPAQILASELDPTYTDELKLYTFQKLQSLGVPFEYQHFPVVEHGCLVRGNDKKPKERAAMERGKNAAVSWFIQHLK